MDFFSDVDKFMFSQVGKDTPVPSRILPYCRGRMPARSSLYAGGGALVVWPGMLLQNSRSYESYGENTT